MAHSPTEAHPEGQLLKEHLENVARLSERFCGDFGAEEDGRLCGLYHDIGKYSLAFQHRLEGGQAHVDHSSAGALLLFDRQNYLAAMCVAGHHAGLADCGSKNDLTGTFMARINNARKGALEDCSAWRKELPDKIPLGGKRRPGLDNYFYTKMLFSTLTDADWLDTEAYYLNRPWVPTSYDLKELANQLDRFVEAWGTPTSEINLRRCRIRESATEHAKDQTGLFSMTVPTGGGKTLASMAFALHHAAEHRLRRVIYVIPYCSVLEQTQSVFEEIFGKNNITAHYSGADFASSESDVDTRAFSTENWETPIILTTAVQFFESLFSNKPGKNRKLHNIAQSVLVFDEYEIIGLNLKSQLNQGFRGLVLFLLTLKIADKAIHRRQYAQNRNLSAERGAASLCSASTRHTLPTYISFRRSTELSACVDLHRLPLRHSTHVPVARAE